MGFNRFLRRHRGRSRGQSLVEFALILPVFLVIVSVALDLGRLAYARVTIANVAREASFQAAQTPTSYQAGQPCSTSDPDANMVICRGVLESKGSIVTVTPSDITLTCSPSCATGTMGTTVTVKATGQFTLLTPVMSAFFGGSTISFSSSATNQVSALPVYTTTTTTTTSETTTSTTTTSTTTISTTAACTVPSAGFTYSPVGESNSPVSVSVSDTSTYGVGCAITSWTWDWGDGVSTYGQVQSPHTYYNYGPAAKKTFSLTLTVSNSAGSATSGVASIVVKK